MKTCLNCGHPVSGGDRHSKDNCPPSKKGSKNRRARKRRAVARNHVKIARGTPIANTGKVPASSKSMR